MTWVAARVSASTFRIVAALSTVTLVFSWLPSGAAASPMSRQNISSPVSPTAAACGGDWLVCSYDRPSPEFLPTAVAAGSWIASTAELTGSAVVLLAAESESGVVSAVVHGNSRLSTKTTYLYRLSDDSGNYLKTGITSNPGGRYTQKFLLDKRLDFLTSGSRSDMLNLERFIVERDPGPWNFERWAGDFAGDIP